MAAKKKKKAKKSRKKAVKKAKKRVKAVRGKAKGRSAAKAKKKPAKKPIEFVLPKRLPVKPRKTVIVYGMRVEPEKITRAAIEAYNKKRYTVHDIKLIDYIPDPRFRNLMVKIAVLDRIEEEVLRIYSDAEAVRQNTVTLLVR